MHSFIFVLFCFVLLVSLPCALRDSRWQCAPRTVIASRLETHKEQEPETRVPFKLPLPIRAELSATSPPPAGRTFLSHQRRLTAALLISARTSSEDESTNLSPFIIAEVAVSLCGFLLFILFACCCFGFGFLQVSALLLFQSFLVPFFFNLIYFLANQGRKVNDMNIFRLAGDVSHLLAIVILLVKIWRSKSCAGRQETH